MLMVRLGCRLSRMEIWIRWLCVALGKELSISSTGHRYLLARRMCQTLTSVVESILLILASQSGG